MVVVVVVIVVVVVVFAVVVVVVVVVVQSEHNDKVTLPSPGYPGDLRFSLFPWFLRPWRPYRAGGVGAKPGPCILYARSYGGSQTVLQSSLRCADRLPSEARAYRRCNSLQIYV